MTALTASYRNPYFYQTPSQPDNKAREEKWTRREQHERPVPNNQRNTQFDEIEALLNELIAMRKAQQKKSAQSEQHLEEIEKKKLLLNVKWFASQSSGEMTLKANRDIVQKLAQLRNQVLEDVPQEATGVLPSGSGGVLLKKQAPAVPPLTHVDAALLANKVSLITTIPVPFPSTSNETPASTAVATQTEPVSAEEIPDAVLLQQLTRQLTTLSSELRESWQSIVDEARQAVITVLVNNPTVLKRTVSEPNLTVHAEQPSLTTPKKSAPLSLEEMLMALRVVAKSAALVKIESETKSSQAVQDCMARMAVKNLKENAILQDKLRQQQKAAEHRGNVFKWLTRIVMAVVGLLVSALTAGFGAMLFSLLFTVVEVVLEETVGFSLTSKIAEGIGKGLSAFMKLCGASGEWVEYLADALAQVIVLVASILVAKGASKLSSLPCVKKILTFLRGFKYGKALLTATKESAPRWLQMLAKYANVFRLAMGGAHLSFAANEVVKSVASAKTQRDLAANEVDMMTIEKLGEIVKQMLKNTPESLTQSMKMGNELAEKVSDIVKRAYRVNDIVALNMANGKR